jgi:hypothetical protein
MHTNSPLLAAPPATVVPYTDRGWYSEVGLHFANHPNYLVGDGRGPVCTCANGDYRNFFVFDLSSVTQRIASATLALYVPNPRGFVSSDGSENYELYDVVTPIASLRDGSAGLAAHADLGDGVVYGNRLMTAGDLGNVIEISLNSSAIAALESAAGLFAFGGSITTLDGLPNDEYSFGYTNENGSELTELRLTLVPEPATGLLCFAALLALIKNRKTMKLVAQV